MKKSHIVSSARLFSPRLFSNEKLSAAETKKPSADTGKETRRKGRKGAMKDTRRPRQKEGGGKKAAGRGDAEEEDKEEEEEASASASRRQSGPSFASVHPGFVSVLLHVQNFLSRTFL